MQYKSFFKMSSSLTLLRDLFFHYVWLLLAYRKAVGFYVFISKTTGTKYSGLKQPNFIVLQFWRLEARIKLLAEPHTLQGPKGEPIPCLSHKSGVTLLFRGLQQRNSTLCLCCPAAFSLYVFTLSHWEISQNRLRPTLFSSGTSSERMKYARPSFQMRSYSEVLGVRISTYFFEAHNSIPNNFIYSFCNYLL